MKVVKLFIAASILWGLGACNEESSKKGGNDANARPTTDPCAQQGQMFLQGTVTWAQVQPMLAQSCAVSGCHVTGVAASGYDYSQESTASQAITQAINSLSINGGNMPKPPYNTSFDANTFVATMQAWQASLQNSGGGIGASYAPATSYPPTSYGNNTGCPSPYSAPASSYYPGTSTYPQASQQPF